MVLNHVIQIKEDLFGVQLVADVVYHLELPNKCHRPTSGDEVSSEQVSSHQCELGSEQLSLRCGGRLALGLDPSRKLLCEKNKRDRSEEQNLHIALLRSAF